MQKITTNQKSFTDSKGRIRIFNGINLVYKGVYEEGTNKRLYIPNWDESLFKWLRGHGFNLIRLGIVWDAIEHHMGSYDKTYLDWVESMLNLCKKYDIYAFLDMHQDLYGEPFGNGAPIWAAITENCPHVAGELWSDAYLFSPAVNKAYENFWLNKPAPDGIGVQDHYAKMWQHIVSRFGSHDAVIGFDVLNEPFPGVHSQEIFGSLLQSFATITGQSLAFEELIASFSDPEKKVALLEAIDDLELYTKMTEASIPFVQEFDTNHLASFYKKMTTAIRDITHQGIMMIENCYFSNMGIESHVPLISINNSFEPNQAYAPHGYDLVVDTPLVTNASNARMTTILQHHLNVQKRLKTPVLFGEWGAHSFYSEGLEHIKYILDYFDRHHWSHTYWCYEKNFEQAPVVNILNRPYPQAVCGDILAYEHDADTKKFNLEWHEKKISESCTEIYLPTKPKEIVFDGQYFFRDNSNKEDGLLLCLPSTENIHKKITIYFA